MTDKIHKLHNECITMAWELRELPEVDVMALNEPLSPLFTDNVKTKAATKAYKQVLLKQTKLYAIRSVLEQTLKLLELSISIKKFDIQSGQVPIITTQDTCEGGVTND